MDYDDIRAWLRSLDSGERRVVRAEVAKWDAQKKRVHVGGRPKVLAVCPKCGVEVGVADMRLTCPHNRK